MVVAIILTVVIVVHAALVFVALQPIRDLETVARRVWEGEVFLRVQRSVIADDNVLRVGSMFNLLLDDLVTERGRMRALAAEVIAVGDRERTALGRTLHESTAQHVAALLLQLSTAARDTPDPALADRMLAARDAAAEILEEVRVLSQAVYPGVLDDLGLEAALKKLSRDSSHGTGIDIDVQPAPGARRRDAGVGAVLYRVAEEAVSNAVRHGSPRRVRIIFDSTDDAATLEVHDDGCGFDAADIGRRNTGVGLLGMRERLALVDGWLDIKTAPRSGTTVLATIPLGAAPAAIDWSTDD